MRILMLAPPTTIRGPLPKHTPHLVAGLRALGCTVATESWGRHHDDESLPEKLLGRAGDIVRVRRALGRAAFDVMVVKTGHDWATLARDIALVAATRRRGRRIVVQFHGSYPDRLLRPDEPFFRAANALLLRMADAALLLSSEEREKWQRFYPGGRFFVVSNPFVPGSEWASDTPATAHRPAPGTPTLLFVGRLVRPKGIFELVEAMPEVLRRTPCRLMIAGDGPQAQQVQDRVAALGLAGRVRFAGYLTGRELVAAYRRAHVFVLPSWSEGFPTVLAEAMYAGLPIVTTRIRGAADHLREGEHTLFVPPRHPAALAHAVMRLLADPDLQTRMAQANRAKVRDFSPEVVARRYLAALQVVVQRSPVAKDPGESPLPFSEGDPGG